MRFWQRRAFFFNDTDNTFVPGWTASGANPGLNQFYQAGATIQVPIPTVINPGPPPLIQNVPYAFVAMNAGVAGTTPPVWPIDPFVTPSNPPVFPPPPPGTPGTVTDGTIVWANNGPFQQNVTTSFTTLYQINQYFMPIDRVMIRRLEVNWQGNLRIAMTEVPYDTLRDWDVITPFAPATYPSWYSWYMEKVYLWPYPAGLYPVTISYRGAPPLARLPGDTNIWTTKAEAMVRLYAEGLMNRIVLHDEEAAQQCFLQSEEEYKALVSQAVAQEAYRGIQPSDW